VMCVNAARNRKSLRKTGVIHTPQHSPPPTSCANTLSADLLRDIRSRTAASRLAKTATY
jgi:hypothetical protein